MKKKRKIIICAVSAVGFIAVLCLWGPSIARQIRYRTALHEYYSRVKELNEMTSRISGALDEQGWEVDKTSVERLLPLPLVDGEGNSLVFWNYTCLNPHLLDRPPAYYEEVFNPNTAESCREVAVGVYTGNIYEKDGRRCLIWSVTESCTLLIEYDPNSVEEWEIMKMAESCRELS